jgi:hypothetical protein
MLRFFAVFYLAIIGLIEFIEVPKSASDGAERGDFFSNSGRCGECDA